MDPVTAVGLAGSIIGVIQLTGSLLTLTQGYIGGVRSAPKDIEELKNALQDFSKVLQDLDDHIKKNPQLKSLTQLDRDNGPLKQCPKELDDLHSKLDQPDKNQFEKLIRLKSLKWPLKETEVSRFLLRMERHKSVFILALNLDHLSLSQEIEKYVKDTSLAVAELRSEAAAWRKNEASQRSNGGTLHHDGKRKGLLDWLYPEPTNTKHLEISNARRGGTGNWFLRSPQFRELIKEKPGASLLWAHGIPGAGKTYISFRVIDHLEALASPGCGVAYIYFDYKDHQKNSPIVVLASLVKQLVCQTPQTPQKIEELHQNLNQEGRERKPTLDELYSALTATLASFPRVFLVFDALDECAPDDQRKLLLLFERMKNDGFNVFLTSRPYPGDIQASLQQAAKIEIQANEEDVRLYIQEKLNEHSQAKLLFQKAQCDDITSDLMACTQGMFLLVRFYIEHLCQQTSTGQILATLEALKKSTVEHDSGPLEFVYKRAMETIHSQHEDRKSLALKVLSWLVRAGRTLTFVELQIAVSVEHQKYELSKLNLPDRTTLLDVCAGLVTIDENTKTARLVHYTAQEYLLKDSTFLRTADFNVAMACTTYLSFDVFAQGACKGEKEYQSRIQSHAFAEYAVKYLSLHLRACDESLSTDIFLKFLQGTGSIDSFQQLSYHIEFGYSYWNASGYPKGRTALHTASSIGHCSVTQILLEKGFDASAVDSDKSTPLHLAAREGNEAVVQLLAGKGVATSAAGNTILHKIARRGHQTIFRLLTENGRYISAKDSEGNTALHWAARSGGEAVAQLLIEKGADISAKDSEGNTALHWAAIYGKEAVAQLLIEKGADISAKDSDGDTALHWAARYGKEAVAQLLIEKGAGISAKGSYGNTALHWAARQGRERESGC